MKRLSKIAKDKGETLEVVREGGSHTVVRIGQTQTVVPRHNEINEHTARGIIRTMEGSK